MYVYKNYKTKSAIISTFLLALFADIKCVNAIFTSFGLSEDSSIMSMMYIFIIGSVLLISLINGKRIFSHLNGYFVVVTTYVMVSFYLSNLFLGTPYTKINHLLVFTISALFIPYIIEINIRICLKLMMLLPIIGIPFLNKIFVFVNEYVEWVSMGISYAFMPPILANIIYLFGYYRDESKKQRIITLVATLSNIIYLSYLFQFGSRGPFLCVLGLVIFLLIIKKKEDCLVSVNSKYLFFLIVSFIFVVAFFVPLINFIFEVLSSMQINSHIVDKLVLLNSKGDLSNGRDVIMDLTFYGILDHPFWGNGFDQFCNKTGYVYPHNAILQIIYDGGIFLFCIVVLPVLMRIKGRFNRCNRDEFYLLSFFLFAGIPGSMLSGDAWRQPLMWMFVGIVMSKTIVKE